MNSSLSIIMPALNVENHIQSAVASTTRALNKASVTDYEIIILVNTRQDGTHDHTAEIALELARHDNHIRVIINNRFQPFGTTYWQGVDMAHKEYVMFIPSDDETVEDSLVGIISVIGKADLVVPYTANPMARTFKRRFVSRAFIILCNILFGLRLRYYNGTCIVKRDMILKVPLRSESFAYMVQVLAFLIKSGATYVEVPMAIKPTTATASFKIKSVIESLNALATLFWEIQIKGVLGKIFKFPYVLWWLPVAVALGFFYPALFGHKLFFNLNFVRTEDMPIHFWFAQAFKQGIWHINPLQIAGFPTYLSQTDFLHPITLLFYKFLNPFKAFSWLIAFGFLGQWYGFYLLARKLKISLVSSVFASFVWVFNQWNIQWGSLESIGLFLASVPILFFLVIKISEDKHKYLYALLATLMLAPCWVFTITQITLYLASALVIFAIFIDFRSKGFVFLKYRNTFIWIMIILLSVVIVSPIIKADYAIHSLGQRSGGLSYTASLNDYYNGFDLIHFVSPFIILPFLNTQYEHFYIGILPLLLLIMAWKLKNKDPYARFFKWLAVLTLIIAVEYSPLFYILTKVPIFNLFRGSAKFLFLTNLSLAVLAGFGLDMLKDVQGLTFFTKVGVYYKKFLIAFISIVALINLVYYFAFDVLVKLGFKVFLRFGYSHTFQRPQLYYVDKVKELLSSWFYQFSFFNIEMWLTIITLVLTGLIVALFLKNKVSHLSFSILATVLTCVSSFFIWHRFYSFVSADVLKPTPVIEYLVAHQGGHYRTMTFDLGNESYQKLGVEFDKPEEFYKFEVATLRTDVFMYYGIETLNGHESFITKRQQFMTDIYSQFFTQKLTLDEKRKLFESPTNIRLLSMMNVKYIISSLPLDKPFIKRLDSTITDTQIPLYLYENPDVLPEIYFSKSAVYSEENLSDETLKNNLQQLKDFKAKTLVECGDCKEDLQSKGGLIRFESYKPDEIVLNTETKSNSWLVFSVSFLPGWQAFVDDKEVKIYRANYLFQAIKVPPGTHKVLFKYKIL